MLSSALIVFSLLSFVHLVSSLPVITGVKDCFNLQSDQIKIFITISSLYVSATEEGIVKRELEVNWVGSTTQPDEDAVAVYARDPIEHPDTEPLFSVAVSKCPGGFFRTDVELPVQFFDLSTLHHNPCLGYWAAYRKANSTILSSSCLRIHPFWMGESKEFLSPLRLDELMIPGSHDSGSFSFHREREPLSKYKFAQEESIFNQLVYGLRYFDLRIGYYEKSEQKFYINHNFLKTEHSVISVLKQVKKIHSVHQRDNYPGLSQLPHRIQNQVHPLPAAGAHIGRAWRVLDTPPGQIRKCHPERFVGQRKTGPGELRQRHEGHRRAGSDVASHTESVGKQTTPAGTQTVFQASFREPDTRGPVGIDGGAHSRHPDDHSPPRVGASRVCRPGQQERHPLVQRPLLAKGEHSGHRLLPRERHHRRGHTHKPDQRSVS